MHVAHMKWFNISALSVVLVLAMGAISTTSADPITVHFTVFPGSCSFACGPVVGDPVNTKSSVGTFTFDSSVIPPGGGDVVNFNPGLASSISFHWSSTLWTQATATLSELSFNEEGDLQAFRMGAGRGVDVGGITFDPVSEIIDDFFLSEQGIGYTNRGLAGVLSGRVVSGIPSPAATPEPGTMLLVASGLTFFAKRARSLARSKRRPPAELRRTAGAHCS